MDTVGKKRNPVAVILLIIFTLGIYLFVWYYKANRELMAVSRQAWSVGLFTFLIIIPIAGLFSLWKMAANVEAARAAKDGASMGKVAMFLLLFIPVVNLVGIPVVQAEINKVWLGLPATPAGVRPTPA